ncbi:MAG: hypothetical protein HQK55_16505, partial [Deltaproteobacteria bacterium]|nr:hypothetical protein [Deltaproteobacteria bacterium]
NWDDPTLVPRYLHFVIASIAVAGLFTAVAARIKHGKDTAAGATGIRLGMRYFAWGSVVQIFSGLWLLLSIPREIMLLFMGRDLYATALFILNLAMATGTLITAFKRMVWPTVAGLLIIVSGMTLIRDALRDAFLGPYHSLSGLKVVGQFSPLILFLGTFAASLGLIGYMLKIYLTADKVG